MLPYMRGGAAKLTVRLPPGELDFAKSYAKEHGVSLTALIHRYFSRLKQAEAPRIPEEVSCITGILPSTLDVRSEFTSHSEKKHQ